MRYGLTLRVNGAEQTFTDANEGLMRAAGLVAAGATVEMKAAKPAFGFARFLQDTDCDERERADRLAELGKRLTHGLVAA